MCRFGARLPSGRVSGRHPVGGMGRRGRASTGLPRGSHHGPFGKIEGITRTDPAVARRPQPFADGRPMAALVCGCPPVCSAACWSRAKDVVGILSRECLPGGDPRAIGQQQIVPFVMTVTDIGVLGRHRGFPPRESPGPGDCPSSRPRPGSQPAPDDRGRAMINPTTCGAPACVSAVHSRAGHR